MKVKTKKRVESLERLCGSASPRNEFADQMLYAAMEALDADNLELLIRFTSGGGTIASAPAEERKAFRRYAELYQAEAVRISGRSWPALVRAQMVYRTSTPRIMGPPAYER